MLKNRVLRFTNTKIDSARGLQAMTSYELIQGEQCPALIPSEQRDCRSCLGRAELLIPFCEGPFGEWNYESLLPPARYPVGKFGNSRLEQFFSGGKAIPRGNG